MAKAKPKATGNAKAKAAAKSKATAAKTPKVKAKPKAAKPKSKAKAPTLSTKLPTVEELRAWYVALLASATYRKGSEPKAMFFEAVWRDDEQIATSFQTWAKTIKTAKPVAPEQLEEELVNTQRFEELHAFVATLTPAQRTRALPKMRAFVQRPTQRPE